MIKSILISAGFILLIVGYYYLLRFITKSKWHLLKYRFSKLMVGFHFMLIVLVAIAALMSKYDVYFRGYWTTKSIFWLFIISTFFSYIVIKKDVIDKLLLSYFRVLSYLPIAFGLFLFFPFLGPVVIFSIIGNLSGSSNEILYNDKDYRIQRSSHGVLGSPIVEVYEKEPVIEKKIFESTCYFRDYTFHHVNRKGKVYIEVKANDEYCDEEPLLLPLEK